MRPCRSRKGETPLSISLWEESEMTLMGRDETTDEKHKLQSSTTESKLTCAPSCPLPKREKA